MIAMAREHPRARRALSRRRSAERRRRDPRLAADLRDAHRDLVDIAPRPVLARLQPAGGRVAVARRVRGRVLAGGVVAAADVAALEADARVEPRPAGREAVLAALDGLGQLEDLHGVEMGAGRHAALLQGWVNGRDTRNVVRPGSESTVIEPSCRSTTIRLAVARPSPVPWPAFFVVKNSSKTSSRTSAGIPGPSSATSTIAHVPARRVRIAIVPCRSPSAWIALSIRFVHTWLSSEPRTMSFGSVRS